MNVVINLVELNIFLGGSSIGQQPLHPMIHFMLLKLEVDFFVALKAVVEDKASETA